LRQGHGPRLARGGSSGERHGRGQYRPHRQRGGSFRRRQAVGARPRGLEIRDRRVPRTQIYLPRRIVTVGEGGWQDLISASRQPAQALPASITTIRTAKRTTLIAKPRTVRTFARLSRSIGKPRGTAYRHAAARRPAALEEV